MMYMLNNGLAEIDKYQYLVLESQVRTSRHLHNLAYKVVSFVLYKLPQILILSKNYKRIRTARRKTWLSRHHWPLSRPDWLNIFETDKHFFNGIFILFYYFFFYGNPESSL